ncbi:hypothetical protein E0Z10_g4294 [Xylaria hypoxylon]|uniref:Uncharacterized protein n=1 Tax=Xylaria hypoxylon TaxID=37992 RepID=A0A4Z0Z7E5_9PEZI|nr:hypothetical protein E0Z10_g4294 [Xylaria hypoxylon]
MTSTLPEHLFTNLGDLFNLNFDAAIVVLRHLNSHVHADYRHSDSIVKEELCHPILRFVWADLESESSVVAQIILRYEMQVVDDPKGEITLFKLFESPAMWNSLWAREPFRLFHPTILGRPRDGMKWKVVRAHASIIEESLVKWNGAKGLADHISSLFCRTVHVETGHQFVEMFNDPAIIRVLYKHTAEGQAPATYQDLREIHIAPRRITQSKDDLTQLVRLAPEDDKERVRYTLVAVVRCSGQAEEADRIRLYSVIGHPMSLPTGLNKYVGTYWNIGDANDPGRAYLLFYAQAPPDPISGLHGEPMAHKQSNVKSVIKAVKASIIEKGSSA